MVCNKKRFLGLVATFFTLFITTFAAPNITLTPTSQNISAGGKAVIKIISSGSNRCTVTGGKYNSSNTLTNGNVLLTPTVSTTYTFTCFDSSGDSNSAVATVNVANKPVTPGTSSTNGTGGATGGTSAPLSNSQSPRISTPQYGNQTI